MTSLGFSLNVYILQQKYSNIIIEVSCLVEIFEMQFLGNIQQRNHLTKIYHQTMLNILKLGLSFCFLYTHREDKLDDLK